MHYVIGDIHGQIRTLKLLLDKLHLQPEDKVYFVGDWFDRAYTETDMADTVSWMLENLTENSQFCSVVGNHDLQQMKRNCYPSLKTLIESMSLYETFSVNGQEFLVTHSWLLDNSGKTLGREGFDINDLNVEWSVWDRTLSVRKYEYSEDMPIVIHGHTPTLGKHDIWQDGCRAMTRILKVSEKNINVDCCAFYSPLRGGNLAAYRCEDGAEIYAYEEEDFYKLVDNFFEKMPFGEVDITREQWYFAVLFRNQYMNVLNAEESRVPCFENEKAKWAYDRFRKTFEGCSESDLIFDVADYIRRIKDELHEIVPKYWLMCRED